MKTLQATVTSEIHPLLSEELLAVKNGGYVNGGIGQTVENGNIAGAGMSEQRLTVNTETGGLANISSSIAPNAKDEEEIMFDSFGM